METELILKSDVLDILFENRNKTYGAYTLRKYYNTRLLKAIHVMLAMVILFWIFCLIPKKKIINKQPVFNTTEFTVINKKDKIKEPEKIKVITTLKQIVPTQAVLRPIITKNETIVKTITDVNDSVKISDVTVAIKNNGIEIVTPAMVSSTNDGNNTNTTVTANKVDVNVPLKTADIMPSFPGGNAALIKFLQKNLSNPRDLEEGEKISVKMKFVVGYDGKLKSFETVEDGGQEFNNEVVRVLKKMPNWIPGKSDGQNVSVYYVIPVKFIANN